MNFISDDAIVASSPFSSLSPLQIGDFIVMIFIFLLSCLTLLPTIAR